jgi:hypothetical protein
MANNLQQNTIEHLEKISINFSKIVSNSFNKYKLTHVQEKWMLTKIKFKVMVALESLLEGNKDP